MDINKYKLKWIVNIDKIMVSCVYFKNYITYMDQKLNEYKKTDTLILYNNFVDIYEKLEENYKTQITNSYYNLLNNKYNTDNRFNYILLRHTKLLILNIN